jgi:hypothetical protein
MTSDSSRIYLKWIKLKNSAQIWTVILGKFKTRAAGCQLCCILF